MRVPKFIESMAAGVLKTLAGILTKPRVVREAELFVDVVICIALAITPGLFGWFLCITFFLLRDVFTAQRLSPGKSLYNLRIIKVADGSPAEWKMTVVRNLILLTPILNVVEIFYFIKHGRRLTDVWLKFDVVQDMVDSAPQDEQDDDNPPTSD